MEITFVAKRVIPSVISVVDSRMCPMVKFFPWAFLKTRFRFNNIMNVK